MGGRWSFWGGLWLLGELVDVGFLLGGGGRSVLGFNETGPSFGVDESF